MLERDRLALAARWGALAACLMLAAGRGGVAVVVGAVALVLLSLGLTVWPAASTQGGVWLSMVVPALAVAGSGGVRSPFLPALLPPVFAAWSGAVRPVSDRELSLERANVLLSELHKVAMVLPASLDLSTVVRTATSQVQRLLKAENVVLSLDAAAPPSDERADVVALRANGSVVGWLSVKRAMPLFPEEREALDGLAGQLGLALDNARWFGRVRSVAAQEERMRLARELHDRLGQDLAALGFELDAMADADPRLPGVAESVRGLARALRHTLTDLRTEVDEAHDLASGLAVFLARVESRSGVQTSLRLEGGDAGGRLPLAVEQELLRVAQEAVVNVERHAHATAVTVSVRRSSGSVDLVVADDGVGLALSSEGASARGRYGLMGMRERAEALGGRLLVRSEPGCGTIVSCSVPLSKAMKAAA
jgi:signal transduction histidine kinase